MTEEAGGKPRRCDHHDVCHIVHTYGMCGKLCDYDTRKISAPQPAPSSHLSAGKADPTRYTARNSRRKQENKRESEKGV